MRKTEDNILWVVYQMDVKNKHGGVNVVCEQSEWEALELAHPGCHTLVKAGITNESEAEIMARGTSGNPPKRKS